MAFCTNCGEKNTDTAKFCQGCGTPLTPVQEKKEPIAGVIVDPSPVVMQPKEEQNTPLVSPVVDNVAPPVVEPVVEQVTPPPVVEPVVEQVPPPPVVEPVVEQVPPPPVATNPVPQQGSATATATIPPPVAQPTQTTPPPIQPIPPTTPTPPKKKSGGGKIVVVVIVLVVVLAVLGGGAFLAINFFTGGNILSGIFGDGNSDDPNVGNWEGVNAVVSGAEVEIDDIFARGFSVELLEDGKCILTIDGNDGEGEWKIVDDKLTIIDDGTTINGEINDGVITLFDLNDLGIDLYFVKEGSNVKPDIKVEATLPIETTSDNTNVETTETTIESTTENTSVETTAENVPTASFNEDYVGNWVGYALDFAGTPLDINVFYPRGGVELELSADGSAILTISGFEHSGSWQTEGAYIEVFYGDYFSEGMLNEDTFELGNIENLDYTIAFAREGEVPDVEASGGVENSLQGDSYWIGTLEISNYSGSQDREGTYTVYGNILGTPEGMPFFEIYDSPDEYANIIFSAYIDLYDTHFESISDDGDAWIYDYTLEDKDEYYFSPSLENGELRMSYSYNYDGERFDIDIELSRIDAFAGSF